MSDFNPQIPNANDPNYFKYSDSISNIKADTSKGTALDTFGNAITGATKLADTAIKQNIDDMVRKGAEKERGDFTSALESIKGGIVPGAVQTPTGGSTGALSFASEDSPSAPAPAAIDAALGKAQAVQDALKAGKVNDTYYSQQLNSVVQRTRAQYPGYVDYIDSKMAEITGMNPANAYVKNLMEDINRSQTSKKTEYDKDLDLARGALKTGIPGADAMFNALQANPDFAPKFRSWFANENAKLYKIQAQDAERNNAKGTKAEIADQRAADFTREMGMTVDSNFHSVVKIANVETPQAILDTVADMQANPAKYTEMQMEAFATKILAQKNLLATQMKQRSNQLVNGVSYASDIGSDKVDSIIKSQLGVYDNVSDALKNKDAGAAFYHMNQARAILDQTKDNLLKGPAGKEAATFKFFQDTMGPAWTGLVIDQNLRMNMEQKIRALFNSNSTEARAQPDLDKTGHPVTITQQMNDIANDSRISKPQRAQLYSSMVDIVDDIRNPNAPDADKANVIKHLFDPSTTNILKNFKMDYYDPDLKKNVEGKYGVWTRLTKPDVTDNIAKIAKSDPSAGQQYVNWVKTTGRDLIGEDVRTLNNQFTGHDNLYFTWDSKTKQIGLKDTEDRPNQRLSVSGSVPTVSGTVSPPMDKGYKFQVQQVVNRINSGMKNLSHVMDSFGGDTEQMLLQTLQDYGLNNEGKVTGLPKALGDAVAASRKPQQRLEDSFGDTKK